MGLDFSLSEQYLYGASRLGVLRPNLKLAANQTIRELTNKSKKGKKLSKRQTERLVQAKTEKSSNDGVSLVIDYVKTSNEKAINNEIQKKSKEGKK